MTNHCAQHQIYIAALVDGEADLVPLRSRLHLWTCRRCRSEIRVHRAANTRIREVSGLVPAHSVLPVRPRLRRRWLIPGAVTTGFAAAAAVWLVIGAIADPVPAVLAAATQPPALRSSDTATVQQWCRQASGEAPAVLNLSGFTLSGARMDSVRGINAVTLYYRTPSGTSVTATWMDSTGHSTAFSMETRTIANQTAIVLEDRGYEVLLAGGASSGDLVKAADALSSQLV